MLIGIENYGGMPNSQFDSRLSHSGYDYIELKNGIFDEVSCSYDTTLQFSSNKNEWEYETIFLATFDNTYECGNIQQAGQEIEKIRFYKRERGSINWIFIDEQDYVKTQKLYRVKDTLAYSTNVYEYQIRPVTQSIEGEGSTNSIVCEFEGLWIVDRENTVRLFYNLEYGTISHEREIQEIRTLDGKYPVIFSTGFEGCSGDNSAVIISQETIDAFGKIQYLPDRRHIDKVVRVLGDKKPKLWKDGNGRKKIIMITNVDEEPKSGFNGGFHTISFNWTQIADPDSFEDLVDCGLLPDKLR